tara:strand:- start:9442 stop:10290 length:849 start_codon:yes stop_codon:yes gene_type:complete
MSLTNALKTINSSSFEKAVTKIKVTNKEHRIKAFIISVINDGEATLGTRKLSQSIIESGSWIDPFIVNATTPHFIRKHLDILYGSEVAKTIEYTWPIEGEKFCKKTGLYMKAYQAADYRKIMACTVSHLRMWDLCVNLNEPIMILESDALFFRTFRYDMLSNNDFRGICGLNEPFYATRRPYVFNQNIINNLHENNENAKHYHGLRECPSVDSIGEPPAPQGLAGNSSYVIKPWAAQLLIDKVKEIGIWPNDALICKQLFPFLQVTWPYYTRVQRLSSSTTK